MPTAHATIMISPARLTREADGKMTCHLPIIRETLPNGVQYDTIDARRRDTDNMDRLRSGGPCLPDGRQPRQQLGQPRCLELGGLGGPVSWDRLGGRAEIITFSVDGSTTLNPATGRVRSAETAPEPACVRKR